MAPTRPVVGTYRLRAADFWIADPRGDEHDDPQPVRRPRPPASPPSAQFRSICRVIFGTFAPRRERLLIPVRHIFATVRGTRGGDMQRTTDYSLKDRIDAETFIDRGAVREAFNQFDITTRDGYLGILTAHERALHSLALARTSSRLRTAADADVDHLLARIRADLTCLGQVGWGDVALPGSETPLNGTALEYVQAGSRRGLRALRQVWSGSADEAVRSTSRFLTSTHNPARWRSICDHLDRCPATGADANGVVADTRRIFSIYRAALAWRAPRQLHPDVADAPFAMAS